jgi:hypothetical protein
MTKMLHTEIKSGERLVATDITNLTFFPKGAILTFSTAAWGATSAEFKNIWKICNTANHQADPDVPDLTNRFLRGGASSDFTTGGGADSQSVFLAETNLPSHKHEATGLSFSGLNTSGLSITQSGGHTHSGTGTTSTGSGGHTHSVSGGTTAGGGGHSHSDIGLLTSGCGSPDSHGGNASILGSRHSASDGGTVVSKGLSGGDHTHTLSGCNTGVGEGAHSHDVSVNTTEGGGLHSHTISGSITGGSIGGSTANTGSGTAFSVNTLPSYYTVIYIMKVV